MTSPESFIEIIEYDTLASFSADEQRVREDTEMKKLLSKWRALLATDADVEMYEELTEAI